MRYQDDMDRPVGQLQRAILATLAGMPDGQASRMEVQARLSRVVGRDRPIGTVHSALDRLVRRGLVLTWMGTPTRNRGGRRARRYAITSTGIKAANAGMPVLLVGIRCAGDRCGKYATTLAKIDDRLFASCDDHKPDDHVVARLVSPTKED
jgi:PadR family transcriptional regulator PadR